MPNLTNSLVCVRAYLHILQTHKRQRSPVCNMNDLQQDWSQTALYSFSLKFLWTSINVMKGHKTRVYNLPAGRQELKR